jgi:hypothetical protein
MKFFNINLDSVSIAQYLVIGGLVSITVSPPLSNIFIALYPVVAARPKD